MLHELRELEARVLRLDRAIQGFSLAKTVLPVVHRPGSTTHAEIFLADETLDAIERKIEELTNLTCQLTASFGSRGLQHGKRHISARQGKTLAQPMGGL